MFTAQIITIGTEITSGEILNTNAAWLSQELEELGARVTSHLSMRDHKSEILKGLEWASSQPVIIISGGLGPTSDDMTRECVASFTKSSLEFNESVWQQLQKHILARGFQVRKAHKHQCFFPKGSELLNNSVGSALGFYLKHAEQHFFVLPGPPKELEKMWETELKPRLLTLLPKNSYRWHRWICHNVPESEVAEIVESVIANQNIEVGYRAKPPCIYLKVFINPEKDFEIINKIDEAIAHWLKRD